MGAEGGKEGDIWISAPEEHNLPGQLHGDGCGLSRCGAVASPEEDPSW